MDLVGYLRIVRRRWALIVGVVAAALVVVLLTLPSTPQSGRIGRTYQATATLISDPTTATEAPDNLALLPLFVTAGEVPERAAEKLGYKDDPQILAATVEATASVDTGSLAISSSGSDGPETAQRVNTFAAELIAYLERRDQQERQERQEALKVRLDEVADKLKPLDRAAAANPSDSILKARRDAQSKLYLSLLEQINALDTVIAPPLRVLQEGVAIPEATSRFAPPSSTRDRLLIGGLLGLLLGGALALVVERVDSRLRTRDQVEAALDLPVLAEIPALPWNLRSGVTVLSATEPGSATAEAYRTLRSSVLLLRSGGRNQPGQQDPMVVLVTSARPKEGKTTTVANLAVVMAEAGRRVLVLSFDFRNPRIHAYLDVPSGPGLSDLLSAEWPQDLPVVVRDSAFTGVQVVTSGQKLGHPGALLAGAGPLIARARKLADVVLVDTAPLLSVSDAIDLSPHVDAALVVSRLNRTTAQEAAGVQRLLARLRVPAVGTVLVGAGSPGGLESYTPKSSVMEQMASRLGVQGRTRLSNGQHVRDEEVVDHD
jgi:Mrp family chromosome partitioning ATPase